MDVRRSRRGTTIRLTAPETTELLTACALTMAAYGILQNFMTPAQKSMTLPSLLFISRLGAMTWDTLAVKPGAESGASAPTRAGD